MKQTEGFSFDNQAHRSEIEKAANELMQQTIRIFMDQRIGLKSITGSQQLGKFTIDYTITERNTDE